MGTVAAMIYAGVCLFVCAWVWMKLESRYAEKYELLIIMLDTSRKRENEAVRDLEKKLDNARLSKAQDETYFAERLAAANERARLLREQLAELKKARVVHAEKSDELPRITWSDGPDTQPSAQ